MENYNQDDQNNFDLGNHKQTFSGDDILENVSTDQQSVESPSNTEVQPKKFIDGFNEVTDDLKNTIRNFDYNDKKKSVFNKKIFVFVVIAILFFTIFKIYYGSYFRVYDESMILVINQTKVSPQKIAIYIKTVTGVGEPTIKIAGFSEEEFSQVNADYQNNIVTWFWTVEGSRAQKAFNKQAKIKITKADKYYEQKFTLNKEIRQEFK